MGQALYRKYRSKSLSEIVGQEHVTTTLTNALKQGRISHAYLLTGPRGVGKTSIARILAHEINGLPYDDEAHLDIIEIDAASNRRIDEIRDLRDRVSTAPASAKYKVYIIDEVHMLTREAFNALLKTLEEPPAHVVFILATTEAHKLPETIISRTQRYSFRPASTEAIGALLMDIAKKEKITIDQSALELIAHHADGSFRDSVSLLDQASSISESVKKADLEHMLGLAPTEQIDQLVKALQQTALSVVKHLNELYATGYEAAMIASQLSGQLRGRVVNGSSSQPAADIALLQRLLDVAGARNPKQLLEIVLLQAVSPQPAPTSVPLATAAVTIPMQPTVIPAKSAANSEPATTAPAVPLKAASIPVVDPLPEPNDTTPLQPAPEPAPELNALWQAALNEIKKQYNTLYGIARMAKPELNGDTLTLTFKFAFHQKRLNEAKNRQIFADVIERLGGQPLKIVCVVGETGEVAVPPPDVAAISNIFGGAELLE